MRWSVVLLLRGGVALLQVSGIFLLRGRVRGVGLGLGRECFVAFLVFVVFVAFVGGVGEHLEWVGRVLEGAKTGYRCSL